MLKEIEETKLVCHIFIISGIAIGGGGGPFLLRLCIMLTRIRKRFLVRFDVIIGENLGESQKRFLPFFDVNFCRQFGYGRTKHN